MFLETCGVHIVVFVLASGTIKQTRTFTRTHQYVPAVFWSAFGDNQDFDEQWMPPAAAPTASTSAAPGRATTPPFATTTSATTPEVGAEEMESGPAAAMQNDQHAEAAPAPAVSEDVPPAGLALSPVTEKDHIGGDEPDNGGVSNHSTPMGQKQQA